MLRTTASFAIRVSTRRAARAVASFGAQRPTSSQPLHGISARREMSVEQHTFQAETANLMDIVAKSLYSNSEVFVRELISNASDALEKRRLLALKAGSGSDEVLEIRVTTDERSRTLIFEDTGIGMNRDELLACLGTIAKSGSKEFQQKQEDDKSAIIGQFGVGFYSAFMVAEEVEVTTRRSDAPDSEKGWRWKWNGGTNYTIEKIDGGDGAKAGTRIVLKLKAGDAAAYSKADVVRSLLEKYSYFVSAPLLLNDDRVNSLNAIWTMRPQEVDRQMHDNFYKHLAKTHYPHLQNDRPLYTVQVQTDSPVHLRALLYTPTQRLSELDFAASDQMPGPALYARRVLIKPSAKELLPRYLRFMVGVVDSEDIPLNLSREMLQNNPVLIKIRQVLTDRALRFLGQQLKKNREEYLDFYKNYALFIKEGIAVEPEQAVKESLAKLLLFESSNLKKGVLSTLDEYVERSQADQKDIYYLFAPSRQLAESSPYFEMTRAENREVLFVYDGAAEVVLLALAQFSGRPLVSLERHAAATSQSGDKGESKVIGSGVNDADMADLVSWVKDTLGGVRALKVVPSKRHSEHALLITVSHEMGAARHLLRMGQIKENEHLVLLQPTVHVTAGHPLVKLLAKLKKTGQKETAELLLDQLYDNALITAGLLRDAAALPNRLNRLLAQLGNAGSSSGTILTP